MNTTSGGYKIKDQEGIYFLTMTTVGWIDVFTRKRYRDIFIESLKFCQEQKGLIIYAYVIMNNHVHMIVRCIDKRGLSFTIGDLKQFTANKIIKSIKEEPESRQDWLEVVMKFHAKYNNNNRNYQLWQQDNHPIYLYSPDVTFQKLNYIHENQTVQKVRKKVVFFLLYAIIVVSLEFQIDKANVIQTWCKSDTN